MNDFLVFLEAVAGAGWVYLLALALIAIGLLLFDRQPRKSTAEKQHQPRERLAA